jgi:hypothetical protein
MRFHASKNQIRGRFWKMGNSLTIDQSAEEGTAVSASVRPSSPGRSMGIPLGLPIGNVTCVPSGHRPFACGTHHERTSAIFNVSLAASVASWPVPWDESR